MSTIICYIAFIIITFRAVQLLFTKSGMIASPINKNQIIRCSGLELLLIFIFTTGLMGIMPVLSIRLAILEVLCIAGLFMSAYKPSFSFPIILFIIFIFWTIIGLSYTPNIGYGIRMILKYLYPLLIALFASSIVRNKEIFLKSMINVRWMAMLSFIIMSIPAIASIIGALFWNQAPLATNYITIAIFSLALTYFSNEKRKNLFWFIFFCLPCFIWVFRTDIMGLMIALCAFFAIMYKMKSIPIIVLLAGLSVASIFLIPSVKEKMYFRPDEVTFADFITNNVDEDNINTSGRKYVWEDCSDWFFKGHEITGSGTGRVQTYFYEEAENWRKGGQLHNDFLVMMCDNGLVGLCLFLLVYFSALLHCIYIYHKTDSNAVRLCTITAGASMFGVLVTMYSDNTISYSMATLSYPWGLYGMALGLLQSNNKTL